MGWFSSNSGGESAGGTDWNDKKAKGGANAKDHRTEHDKRAPITDEQVLDLLNNDPKNKDE